MKRDKIIYWIATIILSLVFLMSINMHLLNSEMTQGFYESLGFPAWIVIPNGILKTLALVAILSNASKFLKEWAYAGLFFDAVLAFSAHTVAEDGGYLFSLVAIVAIIVSRFFWGKIKHI
ncbi:DoxX family protein [Portibacter lacus]|uniref:DoxX family protein n=1 Tax=Portibacter lacus TaxID=1099794 RepID=A0AA37SKT4_9BACT|nr:DoxX family protein [Portibacter lacus]GLR15677.1 hypothetical protein GCM10007940_02920 [Portibacter lacus]